ncbi:type II 3-dehydroquinate dehydratase [Arthrobacter sp. NtRootA1]|uniref:type II 3-dehydroquinate dehydratase n=1 Tax=Arthrobacter sp. NtRootA1 TaxID=2830983 RepID=UPI001CC718FE|nr:type II 3-dehydroquinate dehydratase [Arthrobacter sp. NtRootA1]
MKRILLVHGPNLGRLGLRRPEVYGRTTLVQLETQLRAQGLVSGFEVICFQSNFEGEIISFIDDQRAAAGVILNPGALMMSGWALRDCLEDFTGTKIELHISNVFARENFRRSSVLADVMDGFISGLGVAGYSAALEVLMGGLRNAEGQA